MIDLRTLVTYLVNNSKFPAGTLSFHALHKINFANDI